MAFSSTLLTCIKGEEEHNKCKDHTASRSSTRAVSKVNFRALTSVGGPARRAPVICRQHIRSTRSGRSCPRHRHPNVGRAAARQGGARRQRLHRARPSRRRPHATVPWHGNWHLCSATAGASTSTAIHRLDIACQTSPRRLVHALHLPPPPPPPILVPHHLPHSPHPEFFSMADIVTATGRLGCAGYCSASYCITAELSSLVPK